MLNALTEAWQVIPPTVQLGDEAEKSMSIDRFSTMKPRAPSLQGSCRDNGFFGQSSPQYLVAVGCNCQLLRAGIPEEFMFLCIPGGVRQRCSNFHFALPEQVIKYFNGQIH